jgi:hypothetical protein
LNFSESINWRLSELQVTEITHLPTEKCCMVFQTTSPLGSTELYTIEKDQRGKMRVDQFYNSGLPQFVEKSSFGYCTSNDLIISYTLHSFQTGINRRIKMRLFVLLFFSHF